MASRSDWKSAFMASELSPTTKLVLHTIGEYMDNNGRNARVSVGEIVRQSSLSNRAVRAHVRLAHDAGWLRIDLDDLRSGKGIGRKYDAEIPHIAAPPAAKCASYRGTSCHQIDPRIAAPPAPKAEILLYYARAEEPRATSKDIEPTLRAENQTPGDETCATTVKGKRRHRLKKWGQRQCPNHTFAGESFFF
jgi:hypothetical protein